MQKKITKLRHYYIGDFFSLDFLADIVVAILNGKCDRYYSSEWFLAFLANFLWLIFFLTGIFFELGIKIQPKIKNSTQNLPLYYRPYFRSKIWFFLAKIFRLSCFSTYPLIHGVFLWSFTMRVAWFWHKTSFKNTQLSWSSFSHKFWPWEQGIFDLIFSFFDQKYNTKYFIFSFV